MPIPAAHTVGARPAASFSASPRHGCARPKLAAVLEDAFVLLTAPGMAFAG